MSVAEARDPALHEDCDFEDLGLSPACVTLVK